MTELREDEKASVDELLDHIKSARGFDFTGYKRPTLLRRIQKRMDAARTESVSDYRDYLEAHPDEFALLFDTILINVTSFFRDPEAWEALASEVVPRIAAAEPGAPIRVWSTGTASGEEAYSAAMLFADHLGGDAFRARVKIYATDLDEDALRVGRHGRYPADAAESIPEPFREKYLERSDGHVVLRGDLRRAVIFGRHDLLQDPPISRIDLLIARNTLMYFGPDTQRRVLANFHFSLNEDGYLFLGKSEVLLTRSNLFVPVDIKRRVFQPTPKVAFRERLLDLVAGRPEGADDDSHERTSRMREAAFDAATNATLVLDVNGRVAMANAQARLLFGISAHDVGRSFQDLVISYRPVELRSQIEDAQRDSRAVSIRDVELRLANGETRFLDFQIAPLVSADGRTSGMTISTVDITRHRALQETVERSNTDLETAYEELQATSEELETTNEELQSTNEELETTNEELQSTNEELETLNEELQSTNEELETMNDELRLRTDDLNTVNAFMDAILSSLHSGVVVLDSELRVRAWNGAAEDLWGVRSDEAEGRHFLNLDIGLPVSQISKPLREALANGDDAEIVVEAVNRRGRTIECKIRIAPIEPLGTDGRGVIVLMEDHVGAR